VRLVTLILAGVLAAPTLAQAQAQDPRAVRRDAQIMLEAQIFDRFIQRIGEDMGLDEAGRQRLRQYLQESGERRRALARRAVALRRELQQAMYNPNTPDDRFTRIVNDLRDLRREEQKLWEADHEALSRVLTPRQHAIFVLEWTRFQDRIREIAAPRGAGVRRQP